jgi:HKD family nuclease
LLLTDNTDNRVVAITAHFTPGTAFVSMASDSGVGHIVGTINLTTGLITPLAIGFANPHGMIFVPGS